MHAVYEPWIWTRISCFSVTFFSAGLQEHAVLLRELLRWVSLRSIYAFMYSLCEFLFMEYVSMLVCSLNWPEYFRARGIRQICSSWISSLNSARLSTCGMACVAGHVIRCPWALKISPWGSGRYLKVIPGALLPTLTKKGRRHMR
jgi:hypothetical protein